MFARLKRLGKSKSCDSTTRPTLFWRENGLRDDDYVKIGLETFALFRISHLQMQKIRLTLYCSLHPARDFLFPVK